MLSPPPLSNLCQRQNKKEYMFLFNLVFDNKKFDHHANQTTKPLIQASFFPFNMARRMPPFESNPWGIHPMPLSIFLLVAWIMASVAILTSLCASCYPKSKPKSNKPKEDGQENSDEETDDNEEGTEEGDGHPNEDERITELDIAIHGPIRPTVEPVGSASKRRLSVSMSMGLKEGLSRMTTMTAKKKEKKTGEESLWKKTIILGGKCKFQNDEDEENGEGSGNSSAMQSSSESQSQPLQLPSKLQSEAQPVSRGTSSSSSSTDTDTDTDTEVVVHS